MRLLSYISIFGLLIGACSEQDPAQQAAPTTAEKVAPLPAHIASPHRAPEPPAAASRPARPVHVERAPQAPLPEAAPVSRTAAKAKAKGKSRVRTADIPAPTVEIERSRALLKFFQALENTERKRGITRISHYGASVLGSDGPTSVTRRALWKGFGNAGKGWVNIGAGWKWYRPRDISFKPSGWKTRTVVNHKLKDGRYGFGGVAAIGGKGSRTVLKGHGDHLELWFKSGPRSGKVSVTIDDEPAEVFSIQSDTEMDNVKRFKMAAGKHTITIAGAGGGAVRLYGAVLESGKHGVVYDAIPLIGARGSRLLKYDETHLAGQIEKRRPDLIIANFGGNELVDANMNMAIYEKQYRTALKRLFAGNPDASCLVMGPTDHANKKNGRVIADPQLPKVIASQRKLARELGCAFFDSAGATGGLGSSIRTQRTKKPLYYTDYAHLTPEGNKVLGTQTHRALMAAYAAWKRSY